MPLAGLKITHPLGNTSLSGLKANFPIPTVEELMQRKPMGTLGAGGEAIIEGTKPITQGAGALQTLKNVLQTPVEKLPSFPWQKVPIVGKTVAKAVEYMRPKTKEEFVIQTLPIGGERIVGDLSKGATKKIAKSIKPQEIFSILKKEIPELADDVATKLSETLKSITKSKEIQPIVNDALKGWGKIIPKELQPLAQEAISKGISKEEWIKGQIPKELEDAIIKEAKVSNRTPEEFISKVRGGSTQYGEYNSILRKYGTSPTSARISDLGVNPEKEITIYRGIDDLSGKVRRTIRDGDFVTTDFESALTYTDSPKNVVSKKIKAKDLIKQFASDFDAKDPFYTGADFIYSDSKNPLIKLTDSQLSSLYDAAVKGKPLAQEAIKKYGIGSDKQFIDNFTNIAKQSGSVKNFEKLVGQTEGKQVFKDAGVNLTDFYNQATKGVKAVSEELAPTIPKLTTEVSGGNTLNKLIKALDESVPLRAEQKALYSQEMAKRTARVAAMGEKVGGEKGFFAQLGQLKGELPKKQFEAIRGQFAQGEIDSLFNTIEQTKTLLPLEKVATKGGLTKLLEGAVPTNSEIELLRQTFPKELVDAILARRPILERLAEFGIELTNVPRTMMATTDLSFGLRQGVFMLGRPKQFFPAFKDQFKFFGSEKAYQGLIESIKARPTYLKMKQAGLALTDIGGQLSKREEVFMGNLAEKIPLYGRMVRASNRAYTGFANKLRADLFDDILSKAKIVGKEVDDNLLKSLAEFINAGTGRGKFGLEMTGILPKSLEKAAPVMNAAFFSPRLMASRLNLLNPYFYAQLNPFVRKEALKTLFADTAIFGSLYGLWKLSGGEVGLDPRSADFGKVKIGNTRYDVLGGFQQYIRLASQLISGEIVSSTTGRTITLGEGYKPLTREEILLRFFENKTSPIASFVIGLLKGQTATGEDVDVPAEIVNRFIPMVVQDLYDISQEKGAEGLLAGLPAIFGVGIQTYGKQELVLGESKIGEPTAQIRPVPELAEKIRELVLGQLPLGTSKSYSVEAYYDQLSNLPREEAADIWDKINTANPDLSKKITDVVKEREKGITVEDKDLKAKGVASGDRALAIKKELDKLKTKEEKAALWEDYVKKGVITKEVARQLMVLFKE